jgi:FtsP/CotA-like multicopper oxidase with cupredoxin domain
MGHRPRYPDTRDDADTAVGPARGQRRLSRRRFLVLGAGLVATAGGGWAVYSTSARPTGNPIEPTSPQVAYAERVRRATNPATTPVTLDATVGEVDLGGITVRTWTYGGELPGREIRLNRGEVLKARLINGLPQPTTVHWHGIALRNDMDGVPDLTQPPIAPQEGFDYEFVVPAAGTHWFHPHVGTQLDRGLYAPLIVEDSDEAGDYDDELVITLDDWLDGIDTDPDTVLDNLKADGMDHGAMDMDDGEMPGMPTSELLGGDAGDVTYPHMLANGRIADAPRSFPTKPGQRIRLRLINAASDTAFRVGVPGLPMLITHTDGFPVIAKEGSAVLLGMGERIDAIITMPEASVPVLALAEGRDSHARVTLSVGNGGSADVNDAVIRQLREQTVLTIADFQATDEVALPDSSPDVTHDLILRGPTTNNEWMINDTVFDHDNPLRGSLPVNPDQRVRLRFRNDTSMFHPMHLHGHTFQVRGRNSPGARKDTVIVLPGEALEVDFDADNPGQWLTHCHNVYHGETEMMSVLSYLE